MGIPNGQASSDLLLGLGPEMTLAVPWDDDPSGSFIIKQPIEAIFLVRDF